MKDLIPLKSLERDELELSLLQSADDDRPSPAALRKTAIALGVPAALIGVAAAASSASAASAGAGAAAVASSSSTAAAGSAAAAASTVAAGSAVATSAGIVGLSKAVVVGLGASAVISGAVVTTVVVRPNPPAVEHTVSVASATILTRPAPAPQKSAPPAPPAPLLSATPVIDIEALPRVAPAPSRAASAAPSVASAAPEPPPSPPTSSVADEVAELDRARALVAAKRPGAALTVLDEFTRRWPRAILAPEAAVLRVEAELARGNRAAAERLARALIAAQPNSAYARKVANLVGIEQKE